MINEPTRIQKKSATLIDHIYCTDRRLIAESGTAELHLSDHRLIYCSLNCQKSKTHTATQRSLRFRSYAKLNEFKLKHDLTIQPWSTIDAFSDVNDMYNSFINLFVSCWERHAPLKSKIVRNNSCPWFNNDCLASMRTRDRAYQRFKQSGNDSDWMSYKSARNYVNSIIRNAKRAFFIDSARANPKTFWRNVKACTGLGKIKSSTLPWPHSSPSTCKMSADMVNRHFIDSISQLTNDAGKAATSSLPTNLHAPNTINPTFNFRTISSNDVLRAINIIKLKSTVDQDDISQKMLKISANIIAPVLANIFNRSVQSCTFPDCWKLSIVTPVFKKGNKFLVTNYRPISILSAVSKVFERVIYEQLLDHFERTKLISPCQHGFLPKRSCQTALISLTNRLFKARDERLHSIIVSLDYSKAFDCINYQILLQRLLASGLSLRTVEWFRSYLSNRRQSVKYNGILSDQLPVLTGVPQGSILGPILLTVYLNDLLKSFDPDHILAYADDVTLICSNKILSSAVNDIQNMLDYVSNWSSVSQLTLNITKCKYLIISPPKKRSNSAITISLNGAPLAVEDKLTILGITITSSLSWSDHANAMRSKINGKLNTIRRFGRTLNSKTRVLAFNSYIRPHIEYCLPVWGNTNATTTKAMDRVLQRTIKILSNNQQISALNKEAFVTYNIPSFNSIVLLHNMSLMFNVMHNSAQVMFDDMNVTLLNTNHLTRASQHYKLQSRKLNFTCTEQSFYAAGPKQWNSLPNAITSTKTFTHFKNNLRTYLISKYDS